MGDARDSRPAVWNRRDAVVSVNGISRDADYTGPRALGPHLARSAIFLGLVLTFMVFWAIGLAFSTLAALLSQVGVHTLDFGPKIDSGLSILGLCGMFGFGTAWAISLFMPIREFVDEGGVLLRGEADRLDLVHSSIRQVIDQYSPPFTADSDELDGSFTLYVASPREWALIVAQQIGPDLRVGWTMWRSRSTVSLIGDVFSGPREHDPRLLEANFCSAMRELLRSAIDDSIKGLPLRDDS